MKKIELTREQIARVCEMADEKWVDGDIRTPHDVYDILDLAKHVLGVEVPEISQMKIDRFGLEGEDFRLHVQVVGGLWLSTRILCVDDFNHNNGRHTRVATEYVLRTLVYLRNMLVIQAEEAF